MSSIASAFIVNGWTLYEHPLFTQQLTELVAQVGKLKAQSPSTYQQKAATKRLAAIVKLATEVIPQDPARPEYRQGKNLGGTYKHWFRAKFFQQYRLFFRFQQNAKIIVYAWVNDERTKRAYESSSDAYAVFARMLQSGHPPDNWSALLVESSPLKV